ncbi:MAG: hypothetical protein HC765_03755, partial [Brachymonas sp.]|nr:hypothetical protein [Brachymonas sp.]
HQYHALRPRHGRAHTGCHSAFLSQIGHYPARNLRGVLLNQEQINRYPKMSIPATQRLRFAHSDWSGVSVFEEAFTRGLHAVL